MPLLNKLHDNNIPQLKSAVRVFGDVWAHGDGNIYTSEKESNDRATFYNDHPANIGAAYRKKYGRSDALPATKTELERQLIDAYSAEAERKNAEAITTPAANLVFKVEPEDGLSVAGTPTPSVKPIPAPAPETVVGPEEKKPATIPADPKADKADKK